MWRALVLVPVLAIAQAQGPGGEFRVRIDLPPSMSAREHPPAAVVWLEPVKTASARLAVPGRFTLLQKNRTFSPHLLVVPVGSVVNFPNADPFFHNVFSFFNGKRFDLGLYEAGTSKEVIFSREGVSYIFCNIHPEMSAVILALETPFYGVADSSAHVSMHDVPPGDYVVHIWVEGLMQPALDRMARRVQLSGGAGSITIDATSAPRQPGDHLNKFGQPYDRQASRPY
jgi:plastocyanin